MDASALPRLTVDSAGNIMESVTDRPHWLHAWWTMSSDGRRWLSVYRSLQLGESDDWFAPVRDALTQAGSPRPAEVEVMRDANMYSGHAELTMYAATGED